MLNQCNFIGNLGKDAEIRATQNGDEVATLSLGVSEKWKDKNTGEQKQKTEWVRVVVWGNLVNVIKNYTQKGSKLYISGKWQTRKWQDQEGNDRYSTEVVVQGFGGKIVLLDSKGEGGGQSQQQAQAAPPANDLDDEIPF